MGLFVRWIDLPTSVIACGRGFVGALFLYLIYAASTKSFKLDLNAIRANLIWLVLSGIALGVNWILLFEAYRKTSIAIATLCYYMAPIIVMIVSAVLYKEGMNARKIVCILLALVGMVMVSGVLNGSVGQGYGIEGMLLAFGAAVFYATVTILGRKNEGIDAFTETIVKLLVAAIILIPYNLVTVEAGSLKPDAGMIILLVILGIAHTGGAFGAYFSAIHNLPMQEVALFTYLDPVVAVLASVFVMKEQFYPIEFAGAIVLIGTLLIYELTDKKTGGPDEQA